MRPSVAAVCQLMLRLAEVPLRNVVYSLKPNASDKPKSIVSKTARVTKAVAENGPALQQHLTNRKQPFMV